MSLFMCEQRLSAIKFFSGISQCSLWILSSNERDTTAYLRNLHIEEFWLSPGMIVVLRVTRRVASSLFFCTIPTPANEYFNEISLAPDGEISAGPFARVWYIRRAVSDTSCSSIAAKNLSRTSNNALSRGTLGTKLSALFQIIGRSKALFSK